MLKFFKNIISYIIYLVLSFFFRSKPKTASEAIVFMNTGSMGDVIISTLLMENDELFKNDLYFICKSTYKDLFFSYNGKINLIFLNIRQYRYNIFYRINFLIKLRNIKAKSFYNLTAERGMVNDEISFLSGCTDIYTTCRKHTYLGEFFGDIADKRYKSILFPDIQNENEKHKLLIIELTGAENISLYNRTFFRFAEKNLPSKYVVIAPFSSDKDKEWDINKFKELADVIARYSKVILVSDKKDYAILKYVSSENPNIEFENTNLIQLINLINYSSLFIGNDSGPAHIAFKLNKKSVIIISEGHYNNCFPYDLDNNNIKYISGKSIKDISVENVIKLIKELV